MKSAVPCVLTINGGSSSIRFAAAIRLENRRPPAALPPPTTAEP